jgi:hypothetical protein
VGLREKLFLRLVFWCEFVQLYLNPSAPAPDSAARNPPGLVFLLDQILSIAPTTVWRNSWRTSFASGP